MPRQLLTRRAPPRPPADVPRLESAVRIDPAKNHAFGPVTEQVFYIGEKLTRIMPWLVHEMSVLFPETRPGAVQRVIRELDVFTLPRPRTWSHVPVFLGALDLLVPGNPTDIAWLIRTRDINPMESLPIGASTNQVLDVRGKNGPGMPLPANFVRALPYEPPPDLIELVSRPPVNEVPGVPGLSGPVNPANITWLVTTVVIFPVQGHSRRPGSQQALNVLDEQPRVMPSITYCDPPGAVVLVLLPSLVVTPRHHARPGLVQRMLCSVMSRQAVSCLAFLLPLSRQAPARLNGILPAWVQVAELGFVDFPAITAQPHPAFCAPASLDTKLFQDRTSAEPVTWLNDPPTSNHEISISDHRSVIPALREKGGDALCRDNSAI